MVDPSLTLKEVSKIKFNPIKRFAGNISLLMLLIWWKMQWSVVGLTTATIVLLRSFQTLTNILASLMSAKHCIGRLLNTVPFSKLQSLFTSLSTQVSLGISVFIYCHILVPITPGAISVKVTPLPFLRFTVQPKSLPNNLAILLPSIPCWIAKIEHALNPKSPGPVISEGTQPITLLPL